MKKTNIPDKALPRLVSYICLMPTGVLFCFMAFLQVMAYYSSNAAPSSMLIYESIFSFKTWLCFPVWLFSESKLHEAKMHLEVRYNGDTCSHVHELASGKMWNAMVTRNFYLILVLEFVLCDVRCRPGTVLRGDVLMWQ